MAEVKAFRWKGLNGIGVLHIKRADGQLRVIPPYEPGAVEHACIVKDPLNIAALGQDRIAALIKAGQAEPVTWIQEAAGMLHPDAAPEESTTLDDAQKSEEHLQSTATFESFVADQTAEIAKTLRPEEIAQAERALRQKNRFEAASVPVTGAIGGGPKAGPDKA